MKKEFVRYELAVKLKELGFDEPCFAWYNDNGNYMLGIDEVRFDTIKTYHFNNTDSASAPLYQQAFRWFREKYDLYSFVFKFDEGFGYETYKEGVTQTNESFDTYEEAELACLNKLIEIVEQQNQK